MQKKNQIARLFVRSTNIEPEEAFHKTDKKTPMNLYTKHFLLFIPVFQ